MVAAKTTIALVTGANQGIGRAVAVQLARDHGYTVIVASRQLAAGETVAADIRSQGHQATSVQLDLTSDESITNAVKTIEEKYGRLDVLVNNAGIILDHWADDVPKLHPRELYDRTFATNFTGTACLTEALFPLLRKAQGGPNIVFVSTTMGSLTYATDPTIPWYNLEATAYDCSKAAANMLALNYARRLKDVNARVNMVSPGLVTTNLTRFNPAATTPDQGAEHVVKLATAGEGGPNKTFSSKEGPVPW